MKDYLRTRVVVSGDMVEIFEYSNGIPVGKQRTHEVKRRPEDEREGKRQDNLLRARQAVRRLVWCNMSKQFTKMLTLTYAETVLDPDIVKRDIKVFVKQMRRYGYDMRYLYVLEHQTKRGRREGNDGCLHVHMFLFDDAKIDLHDLNRAWKHGQTHIRVLKDIRNSGAYVCKYITKENYAEFGSHVYGVSRGLNRSVQERFFEEGYTDTLIEGVQTRQIFEGVDVCYSSTFRHDYHDEKGVAQVQTVKYSQGRWKDSNLLELLKDKGVEIDGELTSSYDTAILDEIYERFRESVASNEE